MLELLPRRLPPHLLGDSLWTLLRCTNLIERFNRELRRRLDPAGAMHSEFEVSKLVWAVAEVQKARWSRAWKARGVLMCLHQERVEINLGAMGVSVVIVTAGH